MPTLPLAAILCYNPAMTDDHKSTFRVPGDTGWPERAIEAHARVDQHWAAMNETKDLSVREYHLTEAAKWASLYNMAKSVLQSS